MIKNKRIALIGALTAVLALGGAGVAMAAGANAGTGGGGESQEPSYTGSVSAPAEQDDATEGASSEAEESAALESLATVTPAQAEAAAVSDVPGTAGTAELENENGYVVYGVEVTTPDGSVVEVAIDAGTGDVLGQESDSDGESDDDAETADGDQRSEDPQQTDGETADD